MKRWQLAIWFTSIFGIIVMASPDRADAQTPKEQPKQKGPKVKSWDEVASAGGKFLKSAQADDGTWSKVTHPGITAVCLTGLLKSGQLTADDAVAVKGLKHVTSMADAKSGHLAMGEPEIRHKFYTTCVNLQALKASGVKKFDPLIDAAAKYLTGNQVGSTDKKTKDDRDYGGFGYGPDSRGDMSNTHFALDALTVAGVPSGDPVYKRAVVFISRCQNLKGEFNDQPWAGAINDGSFIYVLPTPQNGETAPSAEPRPGYGSMTFAGLKALTVSGVTKDDIRVRKALEWIGKNYSVDINPGRPEGAGGQGYYYYLATMARTLQTMGIDEFTDASGKVHDWRVEILRALANRQKKDGSWGSDFSQWMESDSHLDTAYALIALSYAKPKAK